LRDIIVKDIETKHPYIPGQSIHWFNPGTPERDNWLSARNKFFTAIFPNKDHRRSFIESIVDSALEAELPTSLWGILTQSLKIFASARKTEKRKRVWESKNKREKRFKTNFIRMFHHATICFPILAIVVTALSPICCIIPPSLRMVRFLCFPHMATRDFAEICVLNEMSKCTMF